MSIRHNYEYTKNWRKASDFPTYEPNETKVRADMQELYDQIINYLNDLAASIIAANVPFTSAVVTDVTDVKAAIEKVQQQAVATFSGGIPDSTVTWAMLATTLRDIIDAKAGLTETESGSGSYFLSPAQASRIVLNLEGNHTLALFDAGKALYCPNVGAAWTITIPYHEVVDFPVGTEVVIVAAGIYGINIALGDDRMTLLDAGTGGIVPPESTVRLKKWATDIWSVEGTPISNQQIGDGQITADKLAPALRAALGV